jgi:hypothetical protein
MNPSLQLESLSGSIQNKLKMSKFKSTSTKRVANALIHLPERKVTSPMRKRLRESIETVNLMFRRKLKNFNFDAPKLTRKQQVMIKYQHKLTQGLRNENIKNTIFEWWSSVRSSPDDDRVLKLILSPRLNNQAIPEIPNYESYIYRKLKRNLNQRNCFSTSPNKRFPNLHSGGKVSFDLAKTTYNKAFLKSVGQRKY